MAKGLLIEIEGPDGCGKSTTALAVYAYLRVHCEQQVVLIKQPYYGSASGPLIQAYLKGEYGHLDPMQAAHLFALNRLERKNDLLSMLDNGAVVVSDRGPLSNAAHQAARSGVGWTPEWSIFSKILRLEYVTNGNPQADYRLLLDVPSKVASQRLVNRGNQDIHEQDEWLQHRVREAYLKYGAMAANYAGTVDYLRTYWGSEDFPVMASQPEVSNQAIKMICAGLELGKVDL